MSNTRSKNVMEYRRRIKSALVYAFGNTCGLCNTRYNQWVFEFHHINPETKLFGIASGSTTRSKQACVEEAKKCVMLCANCHREVEYGETKHNFKSNFSEELFYTKINELNGVANQLRKKKYKEQKKLLASSNKNLKPSREELKQLLRTTPISVIGVMYGVSDNGVRVWAKKYDLPNKVCIIKTYTDSEWVNL